MKTTLFRTRSEPWTCLRCGIQLPLRSPSESELSFVWRCANCGCKRAGVFDITAREGIFRNVTRCSRLAAESEQRYQEMYADLTSPPPAVGAER